MVLNVPISISSFCQFQTPIARTPHIISCSSHLIHPDLGNSGIAGSVPNTPFDRLVSEIHRLVSQSDRLVLRIDRRVFRPDRLVSGIPSLAGTALAKQVGSDTYGLWRAVMIKLGDRSEKIQHKAVDDIVTALELTWADLRTWIFWNPPHNKQKRKPRKNKPKK